MKEVFKFIIMMNVKFSSFGELKRFMDDRNLSTRGISVQERSLSVRPIKIPLESTAGKRSVTALSYRVSVRGTKLLSQLLWHALFGTKFKVSHWQFLFEIVDRTNKWDPLLQNIFDVLMICNVTPNGGPCRSYNQKLKCARKALVDSTDLEGLLLRFKQSGIEFPRKAPDIDQLIHVSTEGKIFLQKPKDPSRIGVGYKDKGTLGLPGSDYDPDEIPPSSVEGSKDLFMKLLSNFRKRNYILQ